MNLLFLNLINLAVGFLGPPSSYYFEITCLLRTCLRMNDYMWIRITWLVREMWLGTWPDAISHAMPWKQWNTPDIDREVADENDDVSDEVFFLNLCRKIIKSEYFNEFYIYSLSLSSYTSDWDLASFSGLIKPCNRFSNWVCSSAMFMRQKGSAWWVTPDL